MRHSPARARSGKVSHSRKRTWTRRVIGRLWIGAVTWGSSGRGDATAAVRDRHCSTVKVKFVDRRHPFRSHRFIILPREIAGGSRKCAKFLNSNKVGPACCVSHGPPN